MKRFNTHIYGLLLIYNVSLLGLSNICMWFTLIGSLQKKTKFGGILQKKKKRKLYFRFL